MRHLLGVVLVCGCGIPDGAPAFDPPPVDAEQAAAPTTGAVPAGIYFRHHTYDSCIDEAPCPEPRFAALTITDTPADAEQRAAALAGLPPGYPLVVHTDELGLADATVDGIAVVGGLFVDRDSARALASERDLQIAELADSDTAFERLYEDSDERAQRIVVRVALDRRAEAFPRSVIEGIYQEQDEVARGEQAWVQERFASMRPLCELAPGTISILQTQGYYHWYEWAPAHCGDEPVYVRWSDTLLTSTVVVDAGGSPTLRQIQSVECDQAFVEGRPYGVER